MITPIRITYRLLAGMRERAFGRIVQVTSGIQDQPELMPYAASKAALDKFVRDMAPSLRGTGVLMNLLDPGWIRTDLGGPHAPGAVESVLPGALVPALVDGEVQGVLFRAQDHATASRAEARRFEQRRAGGSWWSRVRCWWAGAGAAERAPDLVERAP